MVPDTYNVFTEVPNLHLPQVCATFGPSDVHFPNMKVNYDIISIRCYEKFTKVTFCL